MLVKSSVSIDKFVLFLIEQGLSTRTQYQYGLALRSALAKISDVFDLEELVRYDGTLSARPAAQNHFRSVWHYFVAYAADQNKILPKLPPPSFKMKQYNGHEVWLESVAQALWPVALMGPGYLVPNILSRITLCSFERQNDALLIEGGAVDIAGYDAAWAKVDLVFQVCYPSLRGKNPRTGLRGGAPFIPMMPDNKIRPMWPRMIERMLLNERHRSGLTAKQMPLTGPGGGPENYRGMDKARAGLDGEYDQGRKSSTAITVADGDERSIDSEEDLLALTRAPPVEGN